MNNEIISDINEAVSLIETYKLAGLIWEFHKCPLQEIKHYVPKGKEELVVVAHKDDKYLSFRLVFLKDPFETDAEDYKVTLSFHPEYNIHIILSEDNHNSN